MRKTKRELILEIFEKEQFSELSEEALQTIMQQLTENFGRGGGASPAYIVSTLLAAGKKIHYQDHFELPSELNPFLAQFGGGIKLDSLHSAETLLQKIDKYYRQCQAEGDVEGMQRCREVAKQARIKAKLLTEHPQVSADERAVKLEILNWLELWLGTPEIFEDWLALRKRSADFQQRFGIL